MKNLTLMIALFLSAQLLNAQTLGWKNTEQHPAIIVENSCFGVAIDSEGNTVMAYTLGISSVVNSIAINKYNQQGALIASTFLPRSLTSYYDQGNKLFLDSNDNVYIQATLNNYNGLVQVSAIAKFNSNLVFQWQQEIADYGIQDFYSRPLDMETDNQFNLYSLSKVMDTIVNSGTHHKIVKYSKDGVLLFDIDIANFTCNLYIHRINDMSVDAQGNIYLHGTAHDLSNNPCAITAKYSSTGAKIWYRKFVVPNSGSVPGGSYASHCAVDAQGNVIVSGNYGVAFNSPMEVTYLIKYSPTGGRIFKKDALLYSEQSYPAALKTDSASNIYHLTRISYQGNAYESFILSKYNAQGKLIATCPVLFNSLADFQVSPGGSVFVLGGITNTYSNIGVQYPTILKINNQLKYEWNFTYYTSVLNQQQLYDIPTHLAISRGSAEVAAAGTYQASLNNGSGDENGFTIVNLNNESIARQAYNGVDEFCFENPSTQKIGSNEVVITPNPTTDFITINKNAITLVEIYNTNGGLVKSFQPKNNSELKYDVGDLPAGVYMIQVTSADGVSSSKLIKEKAQ